MNEALDGLKAHYKQQSEDGMVVVDADVMESEVVRFQNRIWYAYVSVLKEKSDQKEQAKCADYSNPAKRAREAIAAEITGGDESEPVVLPIVHVPMYQLVQNFLKADATVESDVPSFVLLAQIALTITVSTASPERGFSAMKLIMSRLRTLLGQAMLDALLRLKLLKAGHMSEEEILQCVYKWYHGTDASELSRRFDW